MLTNFAGRINFPLCVPTVTIRSVTVVSSVRLLPIEARTLPLFRIPSFMVRICYLKK